MDALETRKVAFRYARALMDAATEMGQADQVAENITALERLYLEVPELARFFEDPGIPEAEKESLVKGQLQGRLAPVISNLLPLLLENKRMVVLGHIVDAYRELLEAQEGLGRAEVTVPVALDETLEDRMRQSLESAFGYRRVELSVTVDPSLLAGAVVRIGDKLIDGSYRGKLDTLRRQVG